jgi:hypothetical protein
VHPSSLLSYYPTYSILDEVVAKNNYNKINLFIDFKNTLQSTYMEHAIVNIVESTKKSQFIDTSVFSALIAFLSFHKMWSIKRGIDIDFFVFYEVGHSYYHINIDKKYKYSRKIDDLYGLDREDRDLFYQTLQANFELVDQACNKMPGIRVLKMRNLEADFIPYYLMTRNLVEYGDQTVNLIYSNDHDLWQCLQDHTYIFSKVNRNKKIFEAGETMSRFLKERVDIPDEYLPLAMSIIGDKGDDVDGIEKIGPKTFISFFGELNSISGNMSEIYDRVMSDIPIFKVSPEEVRNKQLKRVIQAEINEKRISNNLRLVSFELISRALDNPKTTEMLDRRKSIESHFKNDKKVASSDAMKKALERNGVFLEEASIDFLYI